MTNINCNTTWKGRSKRTETISRGFGASLSEPPAPPPPPKPECFPRVELKGEATRAAILLQAYCIWWNNTTNSSPTSTPLFPTNSISVPTPSSPPEDDLTPPTSELTPILENEAILCWRRTVLEKSLLLGVKIWSFGGKIEVEYSGIAGECMLELD